VISKQVRPKSAKCSVRVIPQKGFVVVCGIIGAGT
jgi:hypothetical protein